MEKDLFTSLASRILHKGSLIETRGWKEQKEVANRNLRRQMVLCFKGHPYYQKLFRENGLRLDDFHNLDDLLKLPLTTKQTYMEQPEAFRLNFADGSPYEKVLYDVSYTTGTTTGQPTPFYNTAHDISGLLEQFIRTYRFYDIRPGQDLFINLFPFPMVPHIGFRNSYMIGWPGSIPVVNALPGARYEEFPITNPLDWCVEVIEHYRGTILRGISSFIRRVLMRAQELQKDYSSVRLVFAIGESTPRIMREDLRQRLQALGAGDVQILSNYGCTELQYTIAECRPYGSWHNILSDFVFFEIVDPANGQRLPDGHEGHVAITHLNRRGTVLLRYLVGDRSAISHGTCPQCGRQDQHLVKMPYRTKDLVKLKGTLVNPEIIHQVLGEFQEVDEYQIILSKEDLQDPLSMDRLIVRAALGKKVSEPEKIKTLIQNRILRALEISPQVHFVDRLSIFDPERQLKAQPIVDERPAIEE